MTLDGKPAAGVTVRLPRAEYDPEQKRQLGNFPQAFSHVMLINTARNLAREKGPAEERKV